MACTCDIDKRYRPWRFGTHRHAFDSEAEDLVDARYEGNVGTINASAVHAEYAPATREYGATAGTSMDEDAGSIARCRKEDSVTSGRVILFDVSIIPSRREVDNLRTIENTIGMLWISICHHPRVEIRTYEGKRKNWIGQGLSILIAIHGSSNSDCDIRRSVRGASQDWALNVDAFRKKLNNPYRVTLEALRVKCVHEHVASRDEQPSCCDEEPSAEEMHSTLGIISDDWKDPVTRICWTTVSSSNAVCTWHSFTGQFGGCRNFVMTVTHEQMLA